MLRRWATGALIALAAIAGVAHAQSQTPITRYQRLTGNINFVVTGGSLRNSETNTCTVQATRAAALNGIPAGATVIAAYLYWGGSGSTLDTSVTLNSSTVTASRTFTASYNNDGTLLPYFGAFADVTSRVSGNGTFTFGGLTVNTGEPHCSVSGVASGWSLVVIYGAASERLRAINVFDGLQYFRGSSLTLNPDGFRIPPSNYDGRMAVVTLEGDPGNSEALNGVSEALRFNGTTLDDGINVPGSVPTVQPFDGTVNSLGIQTSYSFDVDTFDVTSLLSPGQTSATTVYSTGGDLVLLLAQIVSATSEPTVDLSLTKTHVGNFSVGQNGVYTLRVSNGAGRQREDNVVTVTDTLPAGMAFVSGTGTGWSCSASGQVVTCTHAPFLDPGQSYPDITLTVAVGAGVAASTVNTATVSSVSYDINAANNTASDTTVVLLPNLSTSTLAVTDLNGGEADPGDTLRYTLTITNTGGAPAVLASATAALPTNTSSLSVVSVPSGATSTSTPTQLNVSGISVPVGASVTIVYTVVVPTGASPGAEIDAEASVVNPLGPGADPVAPQLVISPSAIPSSGTKALYLRGTAGTPLSRNPSASGEATVQITGGAAGAAVLTMAPALQTPLTLAAGNFSVPLWLSRNNTGSNTRVLQFTFSNSVTGAIGAPVSVSFGSLPNNTVGSGFPTQVTLNNPTLRTFPAGSTFSLRIVQTSPTNTGSIVRVHPYGGGIAYSRILLNSNTVINVDSVATYTAAYPGGTAATSFNPGNTVHVRAVVSDPFGSFDITGATLRLVDPGGTVRVNGLAMTQVADSGTSTKTYQYVYALPTNAVTGGWTMEVTAREGTENTVTDLGVDGFIVALPLPSLNVTKISDVLSDPQNGATNPKRIPGAVVRYAITVSNAGVGTVDSSTLVITDPLPPNSALYVGSGAFEFINGTPVSGLTFNAATNVTYSSQPGGGAPYTYTPVPDAQGYDAAVRGVRIAPSGVMNAASGASQPSFTVRMRVRIQ